VIRELKKSDNQLLKNNQKKFEKENLSNRTSKKNIEMAFINRWLTDYALENVDAVQVEKILQPTEICRCVSGDLLPFFSAPFLLLPPLLLIFIHSFLSPPSFLYFLIYFLILSSLISPSTSLPPLLLLQFEI
jgi:hypothetical protein